MNNGTLTNTIGTATSSSASPLAFTSLMPSIDVDNHNNSTGFLNLHLLNQLFLQSSTCLMITGFFAWAALIITSQHVCIMFKLFFLYTFSLYSICKIVFLLCRCRSSYICRTITWKTSKSGSCAFYSLFRYTHLTRGSACSSLTMTSTMSISTASVIVLKVRFIMRTVFLIVCILWLICE